MPTIIVPSTELPEKSEITIEETTKNTRYTETESLNVSSVTIPELTTIPPSVIVPHSSTTTTTTTTGTVPTTVVVERTETDVTSGTINVTTEEVMLQCFELRLFTS